MYALPMHNIAAARKKSLRQYDLSSMQNRVPKSKSINKIECYLPNKAILVFPYTFIQKICIWHLVRFLRTNKDESDTSTIFKNLIAIKEIQRIQAECNNKVP